MTFGYNPAEKNDWGGWVELGEWSGTTPPTTFVDGGNIYDLSVEPKVDTEPTFTYRTGAKTQDNELPKQVTVTIKFKTDQKNKDVLALAMLGTITGSKITMMTALNKVYCFKFHSVPAQDQGEKVQDETYWKVKITPAGARNLISDSVGVFEFQGVVLNDSVHHPTSPYGDIDELDDPVPLPTE